MFFLIGGVQPKTKVLDETPRLCPACGLAQARLKRVDYYLSLFFIPLFPVKKGSSVVICDRCGVTSPPEGTVRPSTSAPKAGLTLCAQCGAAINPGFRYCPNCGTRL